MSSLLHHAFTSAVPGPPAPPGPRANDWRRVGATPGSGTSAEAALLDDLWAPRGFHRDGSGRQTRVPQRAVPSAGGTYAVQWHVLVPPGTGSTLLPGRWARAECGTLLRRPDPAPSGARVSLLLTVQPGRTFGRYRHRAWPLWVADAAYALEAVRVLVPAARLPHAWARLDVLRGLLAVEAAADTRWWLERGLAPELCLARIELPDGWRVDDAALGPLHSRRSPALEAFTRAADRRPTGVAIPEGAREVADQSGQGWVLGASRVESWAMPVGPIGPAWYAGLWQVHRDAARRCFQWSVAGVPARPVSGFTSPAAGSRPLLHGLALLDPEDSP